MSAFANLGLLATFSAPSPDGTGNRIDYSVPGGSIGIEAETNTLGQFQIDPDNSISGDNQKVTLPLVIAAITVTATAATDKINAAGHGLSDGTPGYVETTGTLPGGLLADTIYYLRDAATNDFKLSTTVGGSVVDITTAGTGTHYFRRLSASITPVYEYPTSGPAVPVLVRCAPTGEPNDFRVVRTIHVALMAKDADSDASGTIRFTLGDPSDPFAYQSCSLKLAYTAADDETNWPSAAIMLPDGFNYSTSYPLYVQTKAGESNTNLRVLITLLGK